MKLFTRKKQKEEGKIIWSIIAWFLWVFFHNSCARDWESHENVCDIFFYRPLENFFFGLKDIQTIYNRKQRKKTFINSILHCFFFDRNLFCLIKINILRIETFFYEWRRNKKKISTNRRVFNEFNRGVFCVSRGISITIFLFIFKFL